MGADGSISGSPSEPGRSTFLIKLVEKKLIIDIYCIIHKKHLLYDLGHNASKEKQVYGMPRFSARQMHQIGV